MLKSWKVDDHGKYLKKKQNKIKKKNHERKLNSGV